MMEPMSDCKLDEISQQSTGEYFNLPEVLVPKDRLKLQPANKMAPGNLGISWSQVTSVFLEHHIFCFKDEECFKGSVSELLRPISNQYVYISMF